MFSVKNNIQLVILLIPLVISGFAAKTSSVLLCVFSAALLMLLVNFMPLFHNYEPRCIFFMTFLLTIPINIRIFLIATDFLDIFFDFLISKIFGYPLVYIILLCIEEIVMCVLSAGLVQLKRNVLQKLSEK